MPGLGLFWSAITHTARVSTVAQVSSRSISSALYSPTRPTDNTFSSSDSFHAIDSSFLIAIASTLHSCPHSRNLASAMEESSPLGDAGPNAFVFAPRLFQCILARGPSVADVCRHLVGQDPKSLEPRIHHTGEFVESCGGPEAWSSWERDGWR